MLLKFAYDDFIADRKFNNTTQANINSYKYMIKPFIEYCIDEGAINVEDVKRNHLKNYLVMCQQQNKKPNTINTIILRAKAFFNYLVDEGIVKENIAKKIKVQKVDVKIDTFTDNQINQMLAFYRVQRKRHQSYSSYRNLLIVLVLLGTGIRRKELIILKWDDVDFKNQTLQVHGKSRKCKTVFLTDKLTKEILAFRAFSRSSCKTECEMSLLLIKMNLLQSIQLIMCLES